MSLSHEHARGLLARARDDLYVVRRLAAEADAPEWVLGFHAQQCVEKALKAVLSGAGMTYPRTHNLVLLVELLRQAAHSLPPDADVFGCLVPFAVAMRYEDVLDEEPPHVAPEWFEPILARTLEWAEHCLPGED